MLSFGPTKRRQARQTPRVTESPRWCV